LEKSVKEEKNPERCSAIKQSLNRIVRDAFDGSLFNACRLEIDGKFKDEGRECEEITARA